MLNDKLCECGCGNPATVSRYTASSRGRIKGQPLRFIHGHNSRGQLNPNWHEGTKHHSSGYRLVLMPAHARAQCDGYVFEHVFVAEKALGRPLPQSAKVHHVNQVKDDNRNNNLVICENDAYHLLLHKRERAYKACGHAGWMKCLYCPMYSDPATMWVRRNGRNAAHRACRRIAENIRKNAQKHDERQEERLCP